MTTHAQNEYRPSCQPNSTTKCSTCSLSYDCERARSGRTVSWSLVAIGAAFVLATVAQALVS